MSTIIYESIKVPPLHDGLPESPLIFNIQPRQRIQNQSATLVECLQNGRFISQWLRSSREECINNDTPYTDASQGSGSLLDEYMAVIKQVVGFWSWILRAVKMTCSRKCSTAALNEPSF